MALTYESIATTTLNSAVSSYTFSSIPSTYTDIILIASFKTSSPSTTESWYALTINSDTGSNYSSTRLYGYGTGVGTNRYSNLSLSGYFFTDGNSGNFRTNILHFMNYSNTTTNKSYLVKDSVTDYVASSIGMWRNTNAINSIQIKAETGFNLVIGSTFTLYGIKAA